MQNIIFKTDQVSVTTEIKLFHYDQVFTITFKSIIKVLTVLAHNFRGYILNPKFEVNGKY